MSEPLRDLKPPSLWPIVVGIVLSLVGAFVLTQLHKPLAEECARLGYPFARVTILGGRYCVDRHAQPTPIARARSRAKVAK